MSSLSDETPEGKSIIELANIKPSDLKIENQNSSSSRLETRCSRVDIADGTKLESRKGAFDAIKTLRKKAGNALPQEVKFKVKEIASNGGTPLVVSKNKKIIGVIELQDIIKPGIKDRFERLRKMGVKTVMVTGDNPLTAKYIAEKRRVWMILLLRPNPKIKWTISKRTTTGQAGCYDGRRYKMMHLH